MKKKPGILIRLLLLINFLISAGLVLAYLAPYVNPGQFVFIAFFGLAYPVFLLGTLAFVLFWLILRKRYFILPLLLIFIGWNHFQRHYQFSGKKLEDIGIQQVKVLSYNVHNLSDSQYGRDQLKRDIMFEFFGQQSADILCMQEFMIPKWDSRMALKEIEEKTGLSYIFYENYNTESKWIQGLVMFSRYPLINKGSVDMEEKDISAIYADMVLSGDTFRVYNIHYESIRFIGKDFQFVTDLTKNGLSEQKFSEGSINIFNKLSRAFRERSKQVEILVAHMKTSPYPVILCGDFNDTPSSYVYSKTSENMKDAFIESGKGYGKTYAGKLPPIRIDYILTDPSMEIYNYRVHNDFQQSDHYPVTCIITLPN
jgi:endonuclease/exonuclease/phosphatase family metal-dependent hydrolase